MTVNHNGVNAIRDGKAVWEPPTIDPLRDAARRALEAMDDLIANTTDPGVEALGARHELSTALIATPTAAPSAPADRAAVLREAANGLAALGPLDSLVSAPAAWAEAIETVRRMADQIAEDELRRMAVEAQQPETQADDRAAIIAEILPAWEAMYEPGNVSDYLIGYANSDAAAKGAAEAWLRSEKDEPGRLEWVPQTPLDGYDQESELIERHDDGIDTGPGITVRRRTRKPTP
jgi:hypothetical protein